MLRKEKKTETRTYDTTVEHRCDLCDCDLLKQEGPADVKEAIISCKEGSHYPGEGYGTTTIVDICVKCMKEKVLPWLVGLGVTPREEEYDY